MRAKLLTACAAGLLLSGCLKEKPKDHTAESVQQIRQLLDNWTKAFEAKDVNGVMAMYATGPAVTAYDIVPPLQYKGADSYRQDYANFFAQYDGPLQIQFADDHLEVSGDLAVDYALERISGKLKGGAQSEVWIRATSVFKRIDGKWRDIHDHVSLPVDMATGKAPMDLKP